METFFFVNVPNMGQIQDFLSNKEFCCVCKPVAPAYHHKRHKDIKLADYYDVLKQVNVPV